MEVGGPRGRDDGGGVVPDPVGVNPGGEDVGGGRVRTGRVEGGARGDGPFPWAPSRLQT